MMQSKQYIINTSTEDVLLQLLHGGHTVVVLEKKDHKKKVTLFSYILSSIGRPAYTTILPRYRKIST